MELRSSEPYESEEQQEQEQELEQEEEQEQEQAPPLETGGEEEDRVSSYRREAAQYSSHSEGPPGEARRQEQFEFQKEMSFQRIVQSDAQAEVGAPEEAFLQSEQLETRTPLGEATGPALGRASEKGAQSPL